MASINQKFIICLCFMLASSTIFANAGGRHRGGNGGLATILAAGLITLLILDNNANQRSTAATSGYQVIPESNGLGYIPEALTLGLLSEELSQNYAAIPEMLALNQGLNYGNIGHNNALISNMFAQELGLLPDNIPLKYGQGMGFNGLGHSLYGLNGHALNQGAFNPSIVPQAEKQQVSPVQNIAVSQELGLLPGNIPLKYGQGMGFNGLGHSLYGFNGHALNQGAFNPSIVPQAVKQQVSPVQNIAVSKQSIN